MEKEGFKEKMEVIPKANGNKENCTEKAKKLGSQKIIVFNRLKDFFFKEKNKGREFTAFRMDHIMKDTGKTIRWMEKAQFLVLII